ncbi:uncharacterized protein [Argopecten irradians]|uniref:uncharacterized protein isoform X1 n=1 Tax=Argopecten irradians TaxID=31199 RepID=UPI00371B54DE
MAADNKCEGFLSGTTNMQSKEDEWRLTYAEVVWAMPAVHVPSERKKETVKKNTCRTECTDKLKRRRRRFKRMKFSNRRVLSSYSLDGEHIYQRLSPYNVTLDIDDSFAIVVKPKCVVSLFEETKVKNENNHIRSVKKTTKRKDTQITKKLGTHCCGTYHNNDIKFLDHYRKCHRSQGNSTDKQTSHKHTSTHNTQPKSLNRNNNTTNTTSQPNINNHFAQEDPTTSNTNTSIIGLHTGTSIPLLSCGDIEANPGPIYKCEHQTCGGNEQTFPSIQDLARHISGTHVFDIICGWGDCVWGAPDIIDRDMESHILQHIYKTTIFESLDSWCEALPSGYLDEHSTDLRLCPPALRGDLNLLLLDSSFTIKKRYTIFDHMMYLFHLQQKSPKEYYEKVENFISRQPPGKWEFKGNEYRIVDEQYCINDDTDKQELNMPLFNDVYCVKMPDNTDHTRIVTSRPELQGTSTTFTLHNTKRVKKMKTSHSQPHLYDCPWKTILMKNLERCNTAIVTELKIVEKLQENNFITKKSKFLLEAEDCAIRLSTSPDTTEGVFVCNVFMVEVDERSIFYARYVESGCYTGFMSQWLKNYLLEALDISSEALFLSQVVTKSDIKTLSKNRESERTIKGKKGRTDKNYKYNLKNFKQLLGNSLSHAENCGVNFVLNLSHCVRKGFHAHIESESSDDWFLHTNTSDSDRKKFQDQFLSFPLQRRTEQSKLSEHFAEENFPNSLPLLNQSIYLNYLSNSHSLLKEKVRFEERLPTSKSIPKSFRYQISWLFLKNDTHKLFNIFESSMGLSLQGNVTSTPLVACPNTDNNVEVAPATKLTRNGIATREMLSIALGSSPVENLAETCTIFDSFKRDVIQSGTLSIHLNTDDKIVIVLNDYNPENGKFSNFDYVHTSRQRTEDGFVYRCSCRIYRTLIECARGEDVFQNSLIDVSTSVKCMHCRFLKECVIPSILISQENKTALDLKVSEGLELCEKPYVTLMGRNNTRKFSVSNLPDGEPSFVHITFNASTGKYVISCLNGYCKSIKGAKRNIELFDDSNSLCEHLKCIHKSQEWQTFKLESIEDFDEQPFDDPHADLPQIELDIGSDILEDFSNNTECFDVSSGLWKFTCKSSHSARKECSEELAAAVQIRDLLNDKNEDCIPRVDGCLKGPIFVQSIPVTTCPCGAGWTSSEYPDGVTIFKRRIRLYTEIAPVLCNIHTRTCTASCCLLPWDEGESSCIHVYSSDTAAGDEIGWMYVHQVLNSKTTFFRVLQKYDINLYQTFSKISKFYGPWSFF